MSVVIRADASIHIGNGHIMRCLVLANVLKEQGHQICFASRPQQADLVNFTQKKGFIVHKLAIPNDWKTPINSADYAAWLQVTWQEDAQSLFENVQNTDLVIVDHYGISNEWEEVVKAHYNCKIVAIDDLVRQHQADIIVDQTLLRQVDEYKPANPNSVILAGCDFALINPLFASYRAKKVFQSVLFTHPLKVLVTMGGVDSPNATLRVLRTLSILNRQIPLLVTVLLSPKAPHYKKVKAFSSAHLNFIKHIDFVDDMAELMSDSSVAIGAPGSTSWERACLGIPSVIIPLAENQTTIANNLVKAEAALKVELSDIETSLIGTVNKLLDYWSQYHETNLSICDGLGRERVLEEIERVF